VARDARAPRLRSLKLPKKLRGKVTFSLDETADLRLLFIGANGHRKATLKARGHSGRNSAKLPKALKAKRYAVIAWATDAAGNRSSPALRTIRLRKR
jgi:hypothetical protein